LPSARGRPFSGFYFLFFTVYFFIGKVRHRTFTPSIISPAADGADFAPAGRVPRAADRVFAGRILFPL